MRATDLGVLGLRPEGKLQCGPLGPALLTLGVQSLLLSWQMNALHSVGLHRVLLMTSLVVRIWGGHADFHSLAVPCLGGCRG